MWLEAGLDSDIELTPFRRVPSPSMRSRQATNETNQPEYRVIRAHVRVGRRELHVRFVLAPASADVQHEGLIPERLHESVGRRPCVHIEVDIAVVSRLESQGSSRHLRRTVL